MSKCEIYQRAKLKSLSIPCEILSIYAWDYQLEDGSFSSTRIEVVRGNKKTHHCIGIHLKQMRDLDDAIQIAERDGFERIYVYGGIK